MATGDKADVFGKGLFKINWPFLSYFLFYPAYGRPLNLSRSLGNGTDTLTLV